MRETEKKDTAPYYDHVSSAFEDELPYLHFLGSTDLCPEALYGKCEGIVVDERDDTPYYLVTYTDGRVSEATQCHTKERIAFADVPEYLKDAGFDGINETNWRTYLPKKEAADKKPARAPGLLEVRDLRVRFFSREEEAVNGVSFSLPAGGLLGLVGESGSGKSVTALAVAGLLDRRRCRCEGQILLDGTDLLALPEKQLREIRGAHVGMVFQEPMSAMDPLQKVGKQVEEALRLHTGLSPAERKAKALAALESVELPEPERIYESYPHRLSGGQLQRAMIAAAIVTAPKLLLLDEPTTALDVTVQAQILELLQKLNREQGVAMLFISHNLQVVKKLCPQVAVMRQGEIVEQGETAAVFRAPRHPYTQKLIAAIPKRPAHLQTTNAEA